MYQRGGGGGEIQKKHKLYETGENVLHTCDWNEKEMRLKQYLKKQWQRIDKRPQYDWLKFFKFTPEKVTQKFLLHQSMF